MSLPSVVRESAVRPGGWVIGERGVAERLVLLLATTKMATAPVVREVTAGWWGGADMWRES